MSPRNRWVLLPFALFRGAGFPWRLVDDCRIDPAAGGNATVDEARRALYRTLCRPHMAEAVHLCSADMEARLRNLDPECLPPQDSAARKQERRLYGYLQRFCCKNDTTGFFGPIDYAALHPAQEQAMRLHMGDKRIAERRTLLSYWAAAAIAQRIADSELRLALCPTLAPTARLGAGGVTDLGSGVEIPLSPEILQLLQHMDGATSIAALTIDFPPEQQSLLLRILGALAKLGVVRTDIELAPTCEDPLALLVAFCRSAPDGGVRRQWLSDLELLTQRLHRFSAAGLDERRDLAKEMEVQVMQLSQVSERRGAGQFYADRTVFHEEARGNLERFDLGAPFHDKLQKELFPCLDAFAVRASLTRQEWQRQVGGALRSAFPGCDELPFPQVAEFIARHGDAIAPGFESVAAFDNALVAKFRAKCCGNEAVLAPAELEEFLLNWPRMTSLAFTSPDVLIEAANVAAINRGEFRLIVGEVHGGPQIWSGLLRFQSEAERAALRATLSARLNIAGTPLPADLIAGRRVGRNFLHELPCLVVEYTACSAQRNEMTVPAADLEVRIDDDTLTLWSRSHARSVELCRGTLTGPLADTFALEVQSMPLRFGRHTPRLCVGSLVLQRETWDVDAAFVSGALSDSRFQATPLQRVAHGFRKLGWPQRVFIRSDAERKPVYIDIANPFAVDTLLSLLRAAQRISATEVLPAPERLWFAPRGEPHTCELRLTAIHEPITES